MRYHVSVVAASSPTTLRVSPLSVTSARKRAGFTQRELARAAHVRLEWLRSIEQCKATNDASVGRLSRIADVLGVSLLDLLERAP
jgi:transcriptional regulator with XRE-family HTH domain